MKTFLMRNPHAPVGKVKPLGLAPPPSCERGGRVKGRLFRSKCMRRIQSRLLVEKIRALVRRPILARRDA